jgi:hypothetical protein
METIIDKLQNHTYLNKKGTPIKSPRINKEQVVEAYSYLINVLKGKVSQRLLRLAFTDKAKDFTQILVDFGHITKVRESNTISIRFEDGTSKYVSTPMMFSTEHKVSKKVISENRYITSLYKKIKVKEEYSQLTGFIEETLSKTTLDGEQIGTDAFGVLPPCSITFTKGRYYGPHSMMSKNTRKRLKIDGEKTHSYDIKHSIFQLLSKNNVQGIIPISLSSDFYKNMEEQYGLNKGELLKQVFCHQAQQDVRLDTIPFFSSLRDFKRQNGYKFVHYVYQLCETKLMTEIYQMLRMNEVDFLPMHDSVIFKQSDRLKVEDIIQQCTTIEFKLEY